MRVLVGPRVDLYQGGAEAGLARALAGPEGVIVSLRQAGVGNLHRPLTPAEVALLRRALVGGDALADERGAEAGQTRTASLEPVGYVCGGVYLPANDVAPGADRYEGRVAVVAVTDHANLTWRSPLNGPNDDRVGPRFPSMTGIYTAAAVMERLGPVGGIIVTPGVVAGVQYDGRLDAYEAETVRACGCVAASSELVPVVIVAAHMGLRVAAAIVTTGMSQEEVTCSG
jgi:hypothetical protein